MIRFECDYTEGAHPSILQRMLDTNMEQEAGYGHDSYSERARQYIRRFCGNDNVDIHFLAGGTQMNMVVCSAVLRPYQGVIAATTGHISVHETGAIESTGHKVIAMSSADGKLTAQAIQEAVDFQRNDKAYDQVVQPGMVYISFSTETGTLYSKEELYAISKVCRENNLYLYLDGARFGYALASPANDITVEDIVACCDLFYIGGTKQGALIGEALVIVNDTLKPDFRYMMRRHGALLAKGRVLGIQFEVLFEDGLYMELSRNAARQAMRLREALLSVGIPLLYDSYTNQLFVILRTDSVEILDRKYATAYQRELEDGRHVVRFCTSWATTEENMTQLIEDIRNLPEAR